ncbi:hypothetical protein [Dickeya chrysanthemi]|uniref:Uncharacterized protein n=1 Tax=Dickeya chrysanthemi TaxID=556 RepID=A0ABU8JQK7_DICCH|nr:hypothetical protein [Dickeya chrysanthemi]MCA7009562.1 hypothetical protein [Dickeya chrysanthemi]
MNHSSYRNTCFQPLPDGDFVDLAWSEAPVQAAHGTSLSCGWNSGSPSWFTPYLEQNA